MSRIWRFLIGFLMIVILMGVLIATISLRGNYARTSLFNQPDNISAYTTTQFDNVYITAAP